MRFYIRLLILAFCLALGIYFVSGRLTNTRAYEEDSFVADAPPDIKINSQTNNAETTIKVLADNCGKCHQSTLPTANPKALAIFDLDKKPWYTSVTDNHLEGISRRIGTKSGISDSDRAAVLDFIACIRKDGCKDSN